MSCSVSANGQLSFLLLFFINTAHANDGPYAADQRVHIINKICKLYRVFAHHAGREANVDEHADARDISEVKIAQYTQR